MSKEEMRYEFGANWSDYIRNYFSEERLEISKQHLLNFLKLNDLKGLSFLDIGCGSGMHSLGAIRSGADRVVSLDYDPDSVKTTEYLYQYAGSPNNWKIIQGSILDAEFIDSLGKFDVVYSWGVLHHTGDMWTAIEQAANTVNEDGVFYIALYTSDVYVDPPPEFWLKIKREYNNAGYLKRKLMELWYAFDIFKRSSESIFQHISTIRNYKASRGMSYWTDIKDWLGGWPMEFAGIRETKDFCMNKLGLELLNINAGGGNTEYLFRRKGGSNYWEGVLSQHKEIKLSGPYEHVRGFSWAVKLPELIGLSDNLENPKRSTMMIYEDNIPMGFAHVPLHHIEIHGNSRYMHWNDKLYFSTTDNSDPNLNGREYTYRLNMLE